MAIHFSGGFGKISDKETGVITLNINYQLSETDKTIYTNKKWWGEFSAKRELELSSIYVIEFADGRKGECIISTNSEKSEMKREGAKREKDKLGVNHYYRFYGRGRLGWRF